MGSGYDIHEIMQNAYEHITGRETMQQKVNRNPHGLFIYPFDPEKVTADHIQEVIEHFAKYDDFEKCIELKKIKESWK